VFAVKTMLALEVVFETPKDTLEVEETAMSVLFVEICLRELEYKLNKTNYFRWIEMECRY
jgi:hypothetical protein